jgi:hypothetical protein
MTHRIILILYIVFISARTCLLSRSLASKGGIQFREPLPSNDRGLHTQTDRLMGGIYEVAVEMDLGAMMYIPSFIKNGSGIQKLLVWVHRQDRDRISLL